MTREHCGLAVAGLRRADCGPGSSGTMGHLPDMAEQEGEVSELTPEQRQKQPPHWYMIHIEECVLCGRTEQHRERRYDEPPADRAQRYDYQQTACGYHFC